MKKEASKPHWAIIASQKRSVMICLCSQLSGHVNHSASLILKHAIRLKTGFFRVFSGLKVPKLALTAGEKSIANHVTFTSTVPMMKLPSEHLHRMAASACVILICWNCSNRHFPASGSGSKIKSALPNDHFRLKTAVRLRTIRRAVSVIVWARPVFYRKYLPIISTAASMFIRGRGGMASD